MTEFKKGMIVSCNGMIGKVIKYDPFNGGINVSLQQDPNGIFKKGERLYFPTKTTSIVSQ